MQDVLLSVRFVNRKLTFKNSIRLRDADEELFYIYGTYRYRIKSPNVSGNVNLEEHKKSVTLTTTKIQIESRFEWTVTANRASAKSFTV